MPDIKNIILVPALAAGALILVQGPTQASSLGASSGAMTGIEAITEQVRISRHEQHARQREQRRPHGVDRPRHRR